MPSSVFFLREIDNVKTEQDLIKRLYLAFLSVAIALTLHICETVPVPVLGFS